MTASIGVVAQPALSDAGRVVEHLDHSAFESSAQAIAGAKTIALSEIKGESAATMRARHTNLE